LAAKSGLRVNQRADVGQFAGDRRGIIYVQGEKVANVPEEQAQWRIPKLVLDQSRKQQAERLSLLSRGVRPA
jgi:hypothetical protein